MLAWNYPTVVGLPKRAKREKDNLEMTTQLKNCERGVMTFINLEKFIIA